MPLPTLAAPKLILWLAVALAASLLANAAGGFWIARLLKASGADAQALTTAQAAVTGYGQAMDKVEASAAECRGQLGALRAAAALALDQRDALQATLDEALTQEAAEREDLYRNDAECGAMARCRVCDPIAERLRNPPRPAPSGR